MAADSGNLDKVIDDLGGCGSFQVLLIVLTTVARLITPMSMMMMAFGNYNPGWQCLDNATTQDWNGGNLSMTTPTSVSNDTDACRLYKACSNVQFAPGISTVVTEWELVCDRSWIPPLIISIQMVGVLLGSFLSGYLGDIVGRKRTLIITMFYNMVVNIIAIFSNSWYMFAVMRFLIGIASPILGYTSIVLMLEFVPPKWRTLITCLPTFSIGCTITALLAMGTEDWKYLHGFVAVSSFIAIFPLFCIPESLRWLLVKDKMKDAISVVKNMAKVNGKKAKEAKAIQDISNFYKGHSDPHDYSFLKLLSQLMRKGVRYPTFVVGALCASMSLIYYAIGFGVKSMPGNFYTNFIILSSVDIAFIPISITLPNYVGRKVSMVIFLILSSLSLFVIVGLDLDAEGSHKSTGILLSIFMVRTVGEAAWDTAVTYIGEIFPTAMRSTSISYTSWIARIGAILAPYFIPDNPDTWYMNYLIMAICALICCILVVFLPETKGKPLRDVWQVTVSDPTQEDECGKALKEETHV